jgi:hypothetical protein
MPGPNGEPGGISAGASAQIGLPQQVQSPPCRLMRVTVAFIGGNSTRSQDCTRGWFSGLADFPQLPQCVA